MSCFSHKMPVDINIFDTDCYGVMWHGAYTKWMEIGRVKLMEDAGFVFSTPDDPDGLVFPVVEQQFSFKRPARYGEALQLVTKLQVNRHKFNFSQTFYLQKPATKSATDKDTITVHAETTIVVLNHQWKLLRRLPESLACFTEQSLQKLEKTEALQWV
ncbi:MAG: thioesterase family protein [Cyanobacteria bacterium P01_H01_bin.74]